ncbi:MAG: prolipoprotein diacylglyceryl transferase family protein [Terracidiphilus sp.]|jgi:phosphatidylglycerol:prolipoprotein diacylglycerol transferase
MLTQVHPVLFHIGAILIPSYGALSALGVLLALFLAQRTARIAGVNAGQVWNLCVVALFAALLSQRLLLVLVNWSELRRHPGWMLGLAMIHHPLLAAAGALAGVGSAAAYARWRRMPLATTADALAAPLALGLAFEQLGALLAGSGYGTETQVRWAVTYTNPLVARWSGTPLGIPLHPVQAYAALAFLTLSILLLVGLPARRQQGDVAGLWLLGAGVAIYMTELWRDPEGRGALLGGALDGPQLAAILFVLAGALVLRERKGAGKGRAFSPFRQEKGERMGHGVFEGRREKDEAANG